MSASRSEPPYSGVTPSTESRLLCFTPFGHCSDDTNGWPPTARTVADARPRRTPAAGGVRDAADGDVRTGVGTRDRRGRSAAVDDTRTGARAPHPGARSRACLRARRQDDARARADATHHPFAWRPLRHASVDDELRQIP